MTFMVGICPVCREVVVLHAGFLVRHGARNHDRMDLCAGSGTPLKITCDCES